MFKKHSDFIVPIIVIIIAAIVTTISIQYGVNEHNNEKNALAANLTKQQNSDKAHGAPIVTPSAKQIVNSSQAGAQGDQGIPGPKGDPGTNGKDGAPGAPGANGKNGTNGTPGTNGTSGSDGVTPPCVTTPNVCVGSNGTNGTNGVAGTNGTNGTQGVPGATGATGAQGPAGTSNFPFTITISPSDGSVWACNITDPSDEGTLLTYALNNPTETSDPPNPPCTESSAPVSTTTTP